MYERGIRNLVVGKWIVCVYCLIIGVKMIIIGVLFRKVEIKVIVGNKCNCVWKIVVCFWGSNFLIICFNVFDCLIFLLIKKSRVMVIIFLLLNFLSIFFGVKIFV